MFGQHLPIMHQEEIGAGPYTVDPATGFLETDDTEVDEDEGPLGTFAQKKIANVKDKR